MPLRENMETFSGLVPGSANELKNVDRVSMLNNAYYTIIRSLRIKCFSWKITANVTLHKILAKVGAAAGWTG